MLVPIIVTLSILVIAWCVIDCFLTEKDESE